MFTHSRIAFACVTTLGLVASSTQTKALIVRPDLSESLFRTSGEDYPSFVSFMEAPGAEQDDRVALSGTLLSHQWALTAAHGADIFNKGVVRVEVAGEVYADVVVALWLPHPCYDTDEGTHDLALIHFEAPPWSPSKPYPRLYVADDELSKVLVLVGRATQGLAEQTTSPADEDSMSLRNATNTVDHTDDHVLGFTFHSPLEASISPLEGISARGESGGPALMCEELSLDPVGRITCLGTRSLLGIHSSQDNADTEGREPYGAKDRYLRISTYRHWIERAMASRVSGSCEAAWTRCRPSLSLSLSQTATGATLSPPHFLPAALFIIS